MAAFTAPALPWAFSRVSNGSRVLLCSRRDEDDVVVIGSGIGGLTAAALLARAGRSVTVLESHDTPGGAAHGFTASPRNAPHRVYHFDSGPSLYSGLSRHSNNPLRRVLQAIDESPSWVQYKAWGCLLPEGSFVTEVGRDNFVHLVRHVSGEDGVMEWRALQEFMTPLAQASVAIDPSLMRCDWGVARTLISRALPSISRHMRELPRLAESFQSIVEGVVKDPFLKNWLDLLCFLLSGLPASGTSAAEMCFMFSEFYGANEPVLEYPVGGSAALVDALVRGLAKFGGRLQLSAHVVGIKFDPRLNRVTGVDYRDRSGRVQSVAARHAVISNASVWDTARLLPPTQASLLGAKSTPECASFMHLHLGIDATGMSELESHYIWVGDWGQGVDAPQNVVLVSIPSVLDPSLAPPGRHAIHVYTPGNEPYSLWKDVRRGTKEYRELKARRSKVMWRALEEVIPDVRERLEVTLVGTPLTHARFLRRHHGSYGPAWRAGQQMFPFGKTKVGGLLLAGDSAFPGIGLPAVAASGMIAANSLCTVEEQLEFVDSS